MVRLPRCYRHKDSRVFVAMKEVESVDVVKFISSTLDRRIRRKSQEY